MNNMTTPADKASVPEISMSREAGHFMLRGCISGMRRQHASGYKTA
jgi:hypothetical protein